MCGYHRVFRGVILQNLLLVCRNGDTIIGRGPLLQHCAKIDNRFIESSHRNKDQVRNNEFVSYAGSRLYIQRKANTMAGQNLLTQILCFPKPLSSSN